MNSDYLIREFAEGLGLAFAQEQMRLLRRFIDLVLDYRGRVSLTSLRTKEVIIKRLAVDSLAVSLVPGFGQATRCLDIGSGAGLPSIPLAILNPESDWLAVERNARKAAFLRSTKSQLKLSNYAVVCDDVCNLAQKKESSLRASFVTARALRITPAIAKAIKLLLEDDGIVVLFRHHPEGSTLQVLTDLRLRLPSTMDLDVRGAKRSISFELLELGRLGETTP